MAKSQLKTTETQIATTVANGRQVEETFTIDDTSLPSPQELNEYKLIDPNIISFLLETSKKEQLHRHKIDIEKVKIVKNESRVVFSINWWGMFFAFLVIAISMGLSAYLISIGKDIIGTIFGGTSIVIAASIFINKKSNENKGNLKRN
ncbi:MAG: DUF2335 domain-containing protein [Dysgonamonadaceae bacterium]|jgi:uncharacterized membrane protein|nr:DUF2335 domain-containing protein [Dysgonamonadaceae bacterium]